MGPYRISSASRRIRLGSEDRVALAEASVERTYEPGDRLATFLRPSRSLVRIEEGLVALQGYDGNDAPWTLGFLGPEDWFDADTLTRAEPRVFEVVAMTATRALTVRWEGLARLADGRPAIALSVARSLAGLGASLAETTLESRGVDVRERLERLLLEFVASEDAGSDEPVALAYPFTHQELARAVGASRPHTSFVLGELEALGAVVRRGQQPVLVRPRRLRDLVEGPDRPRD